MSITRREVVRTGLAATALLATGRRGAAQAAAATGGIDRQAVVRRHSPVVRRPDPFSALSVGNGEFAFTADITGLQSFPEHYAKEFPLCTASHWGWHSTPIPAGLRPEDLRYKDYDTHGRAVGYATDAKGQEPLFNWLRQNPHRLHLGHIGLHLIRSDGSPATIEDIKGIEQRLDLWTGQMESRFEFEGRSVQVQTCCHPDRDMLAVRVDSPLVSQGRLRVRLAFPYGSPNVDMADWTAPERHRTRCTVSDRRADFVRTVDQTSYGIHLAWSQGQLSETAAHTFVLRGAGDRLEFVCEFAPEVGAAPLPDVARCQQASAAHWERFWMQGGFIDLGNCTDARAPELERRMVLSLYNTALHCAGSLPSAETGLLCNSWYGKFHLEMHWWHSVHFAAWSRFPLFERSLGLYQRILPVARDIARRQGYTGARWPKMVGPDGHDAPSPVGPLLIWQQPHPIFYAEMCYRHRPTNQTLEHWREIVFDSAEFMASFAWLGPGRGQYVLGPPLKPVSENTDPLTTINPTFELAYWRFGLRVAQMWRERLKLPRDGRWDRVLKDLSPLPVRDGLYLMQEGMIDTYTKWNWEHPALIGAYGMQPGDGVDAAIMKATVAKVMDEWRWERCWGWDFPMAAMAAARTVQPHLAVRALLLDSPKNRYHPNGHNYQRPGLSAYLPGNGGLLAAVAMMAAGWEGGPQTPAPGFPADGQWAIRHEGLLQR